jgi:hypothetical protein
MSVLRTVWEQAQLRLACLLLGLACELLALAHPDTSYHPQSYPAVSPSASTVFLTSSTKSTTTYKHCHIIMAMLNVASV